MSLLRDIEPIKTKEFLHEKFKFYLSNNFFIIIFITALSKPEKYIFVESDFKRSLNRNKFEKQ